MSAPHNETSRGDQIRFVPFVGREPVSSRLPVPLTALVGRATELAALESELCNPTVRLVTLTGAGGTGKTRLALELADRMRAQYADGVVFVSLAAVTDPDHVIPTIAHALDVRETGGRAFRENLMVALGERELLLVLDNVEQVIEGASQLSELLVACPNVVILATSRERLRLRGERVYPVAPLALPGVDTFPAIDALPEFPAVALLVERAHQAHPDFRLSTGNAADIVAICRRLDGLPLAIELAASLLSTLTPAELLARLEPSLPLLTSGHRDLPARLRTMRDAIAWSFNLLSPDEQSLYRRLAVFAGGVTLEAAETIKEKGDRIPPSTPASSVPPSSVLELITSLTAKSLLWRVDQEHAGIHGTRFAMLETIREYGLERLVELEEESTARDAHADVFLDLVESAELALTGPDQGAWLNRLATEHDNIGAALGWLLDGERTDLALRMAAALWRFWWTRGHLAEGRAWLSRALASTPATTSRERARALRAAGDLAETHGDYDQAQALHEEALAMFRDLGDQAGIAQALNDLAIVWQYRADYDRAIALFEESLTTSRANRDRRGVARCLTNLAGIAYAQGDFNRAFALYEVGLAEFRSLGDQGSVCTTPSNLGEVALRLGDNARAMQLNEEALACQRGLGDRHGAASAQANLGEALWRQGEHTLATESLEDALRAFRELGDARLTAITLYYLGRVAQRQGDDTQAIERLREALALEELVGDRATVAACLECLAGIAGRWGPGELAVQCLGAAATLREETGAARLPVDDPDYDRWSASARHCLETDHRPDEFAALWERGRAMTLAEVIAGLRAIRPQEPAGLSSGSGSFDADRIASHAASSAGLTPRELEVLHLIDQGLSGRQIAEALFIRPRTCATHVTNLSGKLGVTSRTAALAAARRLGIL